LELLRSPTDLHTLASTGVERLGALAAASGARITTDGVSASVSGDPERLTQVLTNLVENAVQYGGAGVEVRVSTWQRNGEAGVTVLDTGPGIRAESVPHLFDRFFRVDSARSTARQGSGLGLAICREIVQAHGGRIWFEAANGGGSAFSVALPTS
jgi:signal transduction histidine kinase